MPLHAQTDASEPSSEGQSEAAVEVSPSVVAQVTAQSATVDETAPAPAAEPEVAPPPAEASEEPVVQVAIPTETTPVAEETTTEPEASVAAEVATPVTTEVVPPVEPAAPEPAKPADTLAVDFPDEDVRNILRNVADLFELNLVMPDTLQGRTSIKLRDVTWRQIFDVVLEPLGFTYVEEGNIIKVVSQASLAIEPTETRVFIMNYAKAEEIRKVVEPTVDATVGGKVIVDTRSNALIITERPSRIKRIEPIIEKLDKATEQVMIESKFVEVRDGKDSNKGIQWPNQLSGTITSVDPATDTVVGINNQVVTSSELKDTLNDLLTSPGIADASFSIGQLGAAINFLQATEQARVVNNPTLVTLNNTTAEINIGEEYPIPSYTYNADKGAFEIDGFTFKPIGVILRVTPQINSQGFIRLTLEPEISERGDPVIFGGGSTAQASVPIITTRKTKTQVSLKDGHTLGIGGLIKDTEKTAHEKVPILGDIPGLGRLFKNDKKETERTNLLVFITAKIVSAEHATPQEVFDPRQIKRAQLRRSDISGHRVIDSNPFLPEETPVSEWEKEEAKKDAEDTRTLPRRQ